MDPSGELVRLKIVLLGGWYFVSFSFLFFLLSFHSLLLSILSSFFSFSSFLSFVQILELGKQVY